MNVRVQLIAAGDDKIRSYVEDVLASPAKVMDIQEWQQNASCFGMDPEEFFPRSRTSSETASAIEVCGRCPVLRICASWGLRAGQTAGICGGVWLGGKAEARRQQQDLLWKIADGLARPEPVRPVSRDEERTEQRWTSDERIALRLRICELSLQVATHAEIAALAGCSSATVGRLLNEGRVSGELLAAMLAAADVDEAVAS